jgi:Ca-activated chloride channel family protein
LHINAHLDVDLVAVEATDTVTVMLELLAPAAAEDPAHERPEHTAIVVLDRSGSMHGGRLDAAKRAVVDLVARLDDRDNFGLVTFDSTVSVVVAAGTVANLGREKIARAVAGIQPGGMTDLSSGYLRGLQEARRVCGPAGATLVLLSDGHANSGITDPDRLREVAANGGKQAITTSTIGIGEGYDENLLGEMATGGNGNHSFALDPDAAAAALAGELDGLLSKTVQAASLLIAPSSDVAQVGVLNELPSARVAGGVMVELGDFYGGEQRRVLIELGVPAMAGLGLATVAELTLTYVELPAMEQHTVTMPVSVNVVPADLAAGRVPSAEVQREKLLLQTQRAKREAEEAIRSGDRARATRTLGQASDALWAAPPELRNAEVDAELVWLNQTADGMAGQDDQYTGKRLRSDRVRKSRGYKSRTQGGEVQAPDGEVQG